MSRIAVFGESFDPVHLGHLSIIKSIDRYIQPDQILVIPCGNPPHRSTSLTAVHHRLQMLELACESMGQVSARVEIDDREVQSNDLSYTYTSISTIAEENPQAELFMAVGWDSLANFTAWHRWRDILSLASVLVVDRNKASFTLPQDLGVLVRSIEAIKADSQSDCFLDLTDNLIIELPFDEIAVSSTQVRSAIAHDEALEEMLPPPVIEYIAENTLYRS